MIDGTLLELYRWKLFRGLSDKADDYSGSHDTWVWTGKDLRQREAQTTVLLVFTEWTVFSAITHESSVDAFVVALELAPEAVPLLWLQIVTVSN